MIILLAIDGSVHAQHAARAVVDLFGPLRPTVHVLNVQPPLRFVDALPDARRMQVAQSQEITGRSRCESACAMFAAAGIAFDVHVAVDVPERAIVRHATTKRCDLIVMGTRGLGATAGMALGSVATKVVHAADIPVTLVR